MNVDFLLAITAYWGMEKNRPLTVFKIIACVSHTNATPPVCFGNVATPRPFCIYKLEVVHAKACLDFFAVSFLYATVFTNIYS